MEFSDALDAIDEGRRVPRRRRVWVNAAIAGATLTALVGLSLLYALTGT